MALRRPAPTAARRRQATIPAALAVTVAVAVAVALIGFSVERSSGTSGDDTRATPTATVSTPPQAAPSRPLAPGTLERLPRDQERGLSEADGVVPDGVTVFDDQYPAVARLDPAFLAALRQAARDAAGDGVEFDVDSGWRSARYQEQLLREAVSKYGSEEEAARWVATPTTSAHVSGDAVDIGPSAATAWLSKHGAAFGLCQIYGNEPWHYELRPTTIGHGCPRMYADPTQDPRMQQ